MSYLANEWASEAAPVADVYERAILGKLATRANDDGTAAFPSVSSLARAALCDTETVRRKLRAMTKRGLIGPGDQRLVSHFRADRRPKVYDLLIPAEWYSAQQLDKVNTQRAEEGQSSLTGENRPPIGPAPVRSQRADTGRPNPKRSPKQGITGPAPTTPFSEGASPSVDNSNDHFLRGADDPSEKVCTTPLREGQIRPLEPVPLQTTDVDGWVGYSVPLSTPRADSRGRTEGSSTAPTELAAVGAATPGAELVAHPMLHTELVRIDLQPRQRAQLVAGVNRALLRFPESQVAAYLRHKALKARTATWLIRAFSEYADAIKNISVGRGDVWSEATVDDGRDAAPSTRATSMRSAAVPEPAGVESVRQQPVQPPPSDLRDRLPDVDPCWLPRSVRGTQHGQEANGSPRNDARRRAI